MKKLKYFSLLLILSNAAFSNQHNENIAILDSIPLIEGYELPRKDEKTIQENLVSLFKSFAQRNRNKDGSLNRGTHAKGQCFDGNFEVLSEQSLEQYSYSPELIKKIKEGIFKDTITMKAQIRLANADGLGRKNDDKVGDVRGLSFSIFDDSIHNFSQKNRLDFMMNSTPGFSNGGIKGFYEVVKAANVLVYKDFSFPPNPLYSKEIASGLLAIANGNKDNENINSLADISYWSNIPYTHGIDSQSNPSHIVKYKAQPCSKQIDNNINKTNQNYLQEEIIQRAEQGKICFDIMVQFFNKEKLLSHKSFNKLKYHWWENHDWIEEGGLEWPESALPFYHIAKLTVPKNSKPKNCENRYVNTRIHSMLEHLPIGSISRVRTYVEEVSRANRMDDQ